MYDKVFLGVNEGVLIYENGDFGTPLGIVPLSGEIESQDAVMKEGWIILIE